MNKYTIFAIEIRCSDFDKQRLYITFIVNIYKNLR